MFFYSIAGSTEKKVPDEFCPKLIAGNSAISSEGEGRLQWRDFLCCRQARQHLKRAKIKKKEQEETD